MTPPPLISGPVALDEPRLEVALELLVPAPLPPVVERVGFEILGAVLGGGAFAVGGALTADSIAAGDPFPWWAVGLTIAATVGSTAGVLLAGRLTGADGEPHWTIIAGIGAGALAGLLLSVGAATDTDPDDGVTSGWTYLGAVTAAALPSALAILAFELSVPERQTPRLTVELGPSGVRGTF